MTASVSSVLEADQSEDLSDALPEELGELRLFSATGLETLYRDHAARLTRRFARWVGGDDASDVVHEAFAKLAGAVSCARGSLDCPEAYVATVATNVLRDRARAAARRALQQHQVAGDMSAAAVDPHRLIEAREALRAIERALADMNPRRSRIFLLHRFENLTYAEIANEVGMSEKGVKKQMAKALVELRLAVGDRP